MYIYIILKPWLLENSSTGALLWVHKLQKGVLKELYKCWTNNWNSSLSFCFYQATIKSPRKFTHEKQSFGVLTLMSQNSQPLKMKDTKLKCWLFGNSEKFPINKVAFLKASCESGYFTLLLELTMFLMQYSFLQACSLGKGIVAHQSAPLIKQ